MTASEVMEVTIAFVQGDKSSPHDPLQGRVPSNYNAYDEDISFPLGLELYGRMRQRACKYYHTTLLHQ
jgi:hypothetical protein